MKRFLLFMLLSLDLAFRTDAHSTPSWSEGYQKLLMEKVGDRIGELSTFPHSKYPNKSIEGIVQQYPKDKVLLFGYGSLMNRTSALRSLSPESVATMRPAAAFGFKRLFNYKAKDVSRWGKDLPENERAMLNIAPMTTYNHIINGVVMEVSRDDLEKLVERELGYDLMPMLVADWREMRAENPSLEVKIAYTFLVAPEIREGVEYSHSRYYPVRGYMNAVQEGASEYGEDFLQYWNNTTYLADGTTLVTAWDQKTFSGILDSREF